MKNLAIVFLTVLGISFGCEKENPEPDYKNDPAVVISNEPKNCVTYVAPEDSEIGDRILIEGIYYTVVDSAMIYDLVWKENPHNLERGYFITTYVTNMQGLFKDFRASGRSNLDYPAMSTWDVSNVTDMSHMFDNADWGNLDLSCWDISNVTDMSYMFSITSNNCCLGVSFGDISKWDVSNVMDMKGMFQYADMQGEDLFDWDVSHVTDMSYMFNNSEEINQDLSNWGVGNVVKCVAFSTGTEDTWRLPKPNFENCN